MADNVSQEKVAAANEAKGSAGRDEGGRLSSEMQTLSGVIRDLEEQLDRVMTSNEALKADLGAERKRRLETQAKLEQLQERLRRSEAQATGNENLSAEISHLSGERNRLADQVRELKQELEDSKQNNDKQSRLIERLRAARSESLEEVQSVESQFERSMQLVAHVRAQLMVATEDRDALRARLRASEESVHNMQRERDALITEVEQSRAALDEIRRSLVDAFGSPNAPGAEDLASVLAAAGAGDI